MAKRDFSKMSGDELEAIFQANFGQKNQNVSTNPQTSNPMATLAKNKGLAGNVGDLLTRIGGGTPMDSDYNKLYAQEAIKNRFENDPNSLEYKKKQADLLLTNERINLAKAGYIQDENGNITKAPTPSKPMSSYGVADTDERTPEEIYQTLNPENKALLDKLANYDVNPMSIPGMNNQARTELLKLTSALHPEYNQSEYPARASFLKDFKSGKRSSNRLAANTLIKHMGSLNDTLESVPSNPIQAIEGLQRWGTKQFAGSSPTAIGMSNEETALNAVAGELSNVFKQTGGTDVEIGSWLQAYDRNAPREVKRAYIKQGINLLQGRLSAGSSEYESIMGKPYGQNLINPDAQLVLDRINSEGSGYSDKDKEARYQAWKKSQKP